MRYVDGYERYLRDLTDYAGHVTGFDYRTPLEALVQLIWPNARVVLSEVDRVENVDTIVEAVRDEATCAKSHRGLLGKFRRWKR